MANEPLPLSAYRKSASTKRHQTGTGAGVPSDRPLLPPTSPITTAADNQEAAFAAIRKRLWADHRPYSAIAGLANIAASDVEDFATKRIVALQLDDAQRLVNVIFEGVRLSDDCLLVADVSSGLNLNAVRQRAGEQAPHAKEITAPVTSSITRAKLDAPIPARHEAIGIVNCLRLVHEPMTIRALADAMRQGINWEYGAPPGYEVERVHALIKVMRDIVMGRSAISQSRR